jgi:hypothetical protein
MPRGQYTSAGELEMFNARPKTAFEFNSLQQMMETSDLKNLRDAPNTGPCSPRQMTSNSEMRTHKMYKKREDTRKRVNFFQQNLRESGQFF